MCKIACGVKLAAASFEEFRQSRPACRDFVRIGSVRNELGMESSEAFMTRKVDPQEPLLNAVARKLGRAAGTLANMTHKLGTNSETTNSRMPSKKKTAKRASIQKSRTRSTKHRKSAPKKRGTTQRTVSRTKGKAKRGAAKSQ